MVEEEEAPGYDDITKSSEDVTSNVSGDGVITSEPTSKKDNESAAFAMPPPSYESTGKTEPTTVITDEATPMTAGIKTPES